MMNRLVWLVALFLCSRNRHSCLCAAQEQRSVPLETTTTTSALRRPQIVVVDGEASFYNSNERYLENDDDDDRVGDNDDNDDEPVNRGPPPKKIPPDQVSGDRRNVDNLLMNFQSAQARLIESIKQDYGGADNFETIFMDDTTTPANQEKRSTIGRNTFLKGSETAAKSWARTVRKMKINLLQYLIEGEVQDFVWATAGNAGAAGHGNFFGQQYTMVLQDRARDLFRSVGLDLVARPYGMGGTTSAPEVAGCAKEIYGNDVDIITWDFAMTDGRGYWRMEFFAHRVMMLPNHPTLLVLQSGTEDVRKEIVDHLTEQGMSALRQDEVYLVGQKLKFPDSKKISTEELATIPEHLRYFRCGYGIETGLGCLENKYTQNSTCDEREGRTNWHNGWKWHAFHGNLYSLFLMEVMEDALQELKESSGDYVGLYQQLETEEDDEFRAFEEQADLKFQYEWSIEDVSAMQLYRDPTYCHTAKLPAQTRYLGYVLDEERYDDWYSYVQGKNLGRLQKSAGPTMRLGRHGKSAEKKCNSTLNIDEKNFFLATYRYKGYQKIVIPTDAEINAYDAHQSSGVIAVCANACSYECSGSPLLSPEHIHRDKGAFRVNGEDVASVEKFDNCFLLKDASGNMYWPSNHEKKYEIEVQSKVKDKYFEFSSFIVW